MNAVEIIKMAIKELSSPFDEDLVCFNHEELTNFVNLIAASEREAIAKLCDAQVERSLAALEKVKLTTDHLIYHASGQTAMWNVDAVRDRGLL